MPPSRPLSLTSLHLSKGKAQITQLTQGTSNPLSLLLSDVSSIALGSLGLSVTVFYRLSSLDVELDPTGRESRSYLLAAFACLAVLLNGVSKLDVTSADAERVALEGIKVEPEDWALRGLLEATPAETAAILDHDETWNLKMQAGLCVDIGVPVRTPVLDRFLSDGGETYLPTLQALPGKVEFAFLPRNTQEVLVVPMGKRVLVLGSGKAKSFTPKDIAWCRVVAERMAS